MVVLRCGHSYFTLIVRLVSQYNGPRGYYAKWNMSDRKEKYCLILLICGIWKKYIKTKQKQTHRYKEENGGCQMEGEEGIGKKKFKEIRKYKLPVMQ